MPVQIEVRSDSRQAQSDLKRLEASLNSVKRSSEQINRSLINITNATKAAFTAIPLTLLAGSAVKTAASFETLNARLEIATGNAVTAAKALAGVQKIVVTTPFSVDKLTDAFARLASTGSDVFNSQDKIERGIRNIADAVAAIGGGNIELQRVAIAFERMAGEGRITAERLNQITDAGIPLTKIARALNLSMEDLRKESEKGILTFERFYRAFQQVAEAADGFGGAASRQVNTLKGSFSNLGDALQIASDRIVRQSGVSRLLINTINSVTASINRLSEGVESDIAFAIAKIRFFYYDVKFFFKQAGEVIDEFGQTIYTFFPEFNFDFTDALENLKRAISETFGKFDVNEDGKITPLDIKKFLPNLDAVYDVFNVFKNFVVGVFKFIYDVVVGNSYWPDLIRGVVEWAKQLNVLVKEPLEKFSTYVNSKFKSIKDKFALAFEDLKIAIEISAETGVLKTIGDYIKNINSTLKALIESASQYTKLDRFRSSFEKFTAQISKFNSQALGTGANIWASIAVALVAAKDFVINGIPELLKALDNASGTKDKFGGKITPVSLGQETDNVLARSIDKATNQLKQIELVGIKQSVDDSLNSVKEFFQNGLIFSDFFQNIYNGIGSIIGRLVGRAFGKDFTPGEDVVDALSLLFVAAISKAFRQFAAFTILINFLVGDNNISDVLAKTFTAISQFGQSVLKGAGVPGFVADSEIGGFIGGLLFGGLTAALVSSRVRSALFGGIAELAKFLVIKKILGLGDGGNGEAQADAAGKTIGQKVKGGILSITGIGGAIAGIFLGEWLAKELEITNTFVKTFTIIGVASGVAFGTNFLVGKAITLIVAKVTALGALIQATLAAFFGKRALAAILLSAMIPAPAAVSTAISGIVAAIATAFSLPVILSVLGIAAVGSLIGYILFGGDENSWAGKIRSFFKDNVINPVKNFFDEIYRYLSEGLLVLGDKLEKITFGLIKANRQNRPSINTQDPSNLGTGFANGGRIRGPGSGTSDSITARLSNGEYVVNAAATRNNLPLLERINNGLPAFKQGGYIDFVNLDVIKRFENLGNDRRPILEGYVPSRNGRAIGRSGVTIATGFDLGQRNEKDLERLEFPPSLFNKYKPYLGARKQAAINLLKRKPLRITPEEAILTDNAVKPDTLNLGLNKIISVSNFAKLISGFRNAIGSFVFQYGSYSQFPNLARYVETNEPEKYSFLLRQLRTFRNRRLAESALIQESLKSNSNKIERSLNPNSRVQKTRKDKPGFALGGLVGSLLNKTKTPLTIGAPSGIATSLGELGNTPAKETDSLTRKLLADYFKITAEDYNYSYPNNGYKLMLTDAMVNRYETFDPQELLKRKFGARYLTSYTDSNRAIYNSLGPAINKIIEEEGGKVAADASLSAGINTLLGVVLSLGNPTAQGLGKLFTIAGFSNLSIPYLQAYSRSRRLLNKQFTYLRGSAGSPSWYSSQSMDTLEAWRKGIVPRSDMSDFGSLLTRFEDAPYLSGTLIGLIKRAGNFLNSRFNLDNKNIIENPDVSGFANGGRITGAGTGRSDSILARVSNGEYVVNANATARNRSLLDQINYGGMVPKFANGGPIDSNLLISQIAAINPSLVKGLDLSNVPLKELLSIQKQVLKVTGLMQQSDTQFLEQGVDRIELADDSLNILKNKLVPFVQLVAENTTPRTPFEIEKGRLEKIAVESSIESAEQFKTTFENGLTNLLSGKGGIKEFGTALLNQFTSSVVSNFSKGVTETIFGDLTKPGSFSKVFQNQFQLGGKAGEAINLEKNKLLYGNDPMGFDDPSQLNVKKSDGYTSKQLGFLMNNKLDFASEQSKMLLEQESVFNDFNDNIKDTLSTDNPFLKGLGGIFSQLSSGLGGLLSSGLGFLGLPGFADGGAIPGSSGSAVPVLAHAGEIILNEAQQARVAAAMQNGSSGQQVINLNITGDISRQTKSEIYRMLPSIAEGVNSHNREKGYRG